MSKKYDIGSILESVQKMYVKDKKSQQMLSTGDRIRKSFTAQDGIPLPDDHPVRLLTGLPCVPYNKIIQFSGNADTGKSTLSGQTLSFAQQSDHIGILWDAEQKFDAERYDAQFKGDSKDLMLITTNEILQGAEKVRKIIVKTKEKYPDAKFLFVWDSVGGSQSRSHAERELDDERNAQPGQDAKENASVMKMITGLFNKYPDSIAVVLVNQVYAKIGFMQVGDEESGGKKIKFHSSLIVQLKKIKTLTKISKGVKLKYGIMSRATVIKNHLTQGATSVHQLDFEITAAGARIVDCQDEEPNEE